MQRQHCIVAVLCHLLPLRLPAAIHTGLSFVDAVTLRVRAFVTPLSPMTDRRLRFRVTVVVGDKTRIDLKMPSKFVCILRITFSDTQLCGRCLINLTPVVKVVIHCVFCTIISEIN